MRCSSTTNIDAQEVRMIAMKGIINYHLLSTN